VQNSVLFGLELTPLGIGGIGIFGVIMCAVGYFVAKAHRAAHTNPSGLPFPLQTETPEVTGPGGEQRRHPRFETQPVRVRLTLSQGGSEIDGLVLNQSLGGLCICVPQNLPEGAVLNLRGVENPQDRIKSQVMVKHSRPHRGGWALGCQYL
jgi:PilZ domain